MLLSPPATSVPKFFQTRGKKGQSQVQIRTLRKRETDAEKGELDEALRALAGPILRQGSCP